MKEAKVPDIVVSRLPVYLRALEFLAMEGVETVSSAELAERLDLNPAQIRKDLSYFGSFGRQGRGYNVKGLIEAIRQILNLEREWEVALVGVGDLGRALVHYQGFKDKGFRLTLLFDNNPQKIGTKIGELEIMDSALIPKLIPERGIKIAIIAVPPQEAQKVADALVSAGIEAILNYAPVNLKVPPHVKVHYIDPVVGLRHMTYYLPRQSG